LLASSDASRMRTWCGGGNRINRPISADYLRQGIEPKSRYPQMYPQALSVTPRKLLRAAQTVVELVSSAPSLKQLCKRGVARARVSRNFLAERAWRISIPPPDWPLLWSLGVFRGFLRHLPDTPGLGGESQATKQTTRWLVLIEFSASPPDDSLVSDDHDRHQ
jgi:hypothetical protein